MSHNQASWEYVNYKSLIYNQFKLVGHSRALKDMAYNKIQWLSSIDLLTI